MKYLPLLLLCGCSLFTIPDRETAPNAPRSVVEESLDATVALVTEGGRAFCSGVIIESTIFTAYHCVDQGGIILALRRRNPDSPFPTTVLYKDSEQDLAILSPTTTILPDGRVISPENPAFGEPVVIVGMPYGLQWTMTDGIVANPRRVGGAGGTEHLWVQVSAPVSPGNSGGPVFNRYGEVLGIVSFSIRGVPSLGGATHTESLRAALDYIRGE